MEQLPTFTLFADPVRERVFERSNATCDVCRRQRGMIYSGPKYGLAPASELTICPWCIADGAAGMRGVSFNDATIYPAIETTPQMSEADRHLVENLTPGYNTWQGNLWLMCCGRACVYLGEAEASDLQGRWSAAVPSMFEDDEKSPEEIAEIIRYMKQGGSPAAYVFQCRACQGLRAYWDCD